MTPNQLPAETRARAFDTVAGADRAVRQLLAAGFTREEITVVAPADVREQCRAAAPNAEDPTVPEGETIAKGAVTGAALGGLILVATVLSGGLTVPAAALLIGGSAIAGGFSNLIVNKGYEVEASDFCKHALQNGKVVVGVDVRGDASANRLAEAQRILDEAGGNRP